MTTPTPRALELAAEVLPPAWCGVCDAPAKVCDEDGCCTTCGADLVVLYAGGLHDAIEALVERECERVRVETIEACATEPVEYLRARSADGPTGMMLWNENSHGILWMAQRIRALKEAKP